MANSYNRQEILDMALGHPDDRAHLDIELIQNHYKSLYLDIQEKLEILFDLTLLHGAFITDDFFNSKRDFDKFGENYGYIHAFVERTNKSNAFRFQYRRPSSTGEMIRKNITMNKSAGGHTQSSFRCAGHDLERDLCVAIEEDFLVLRNQSKVIRAVLRKLKSLQFDPIDPE